MVFGSVFATTSGAMRSLADAIGSISENISLINATGYKEVDIRFRELVDEQRIGRLQNPSASIFGGQKINVRRNLRREGSFARTGNPLDVAIQGDGFFVTRPERNQTAVYLLTQAGDLKARVVLEGVRQRTFLANSQNDLVLGWTWDQQTERYQIGTGETSLVPINITRDEISVEATRTTRLELGGYLPADAQEGDTYQITGTVFDGRLLNIQDNPELDGADSHRLSYRFTKTDIDRQWTVNVLPIGEDAAVTGGAVFTVTFGIDGSLEGLGGAGANSDFDLTRQRFDKAIAANGNVDITWQAQGEVDGGVGTVAVTPGAFNVDFRQLRSIGSNFLASEARQFGGRSTADVQVDHFEINEFGEVQARLSNGDAVNIAKIGGAWVREPDALASAGRNLYEVSPRSGNLNLFQFTREELLDGTVRPSRGVLLTGTLEESNADLGVQFVKLIETQRAYSTNLTVMRTADEMSKTAVDLG